MNPGRAGPHVTLRAAGEKDESVVMEWRNDPDTVRFSATARPVSAAEHGRWFTATLADPRRRLWVAEKNGVPVGQVRIDLDGDVGVFSIVVAPSERGQGFGQAMLRAAVAEITRVRSVSMLTAVAREDNPASIHAFEQVGFSRHGAPEDGFVTLELRLV